MIRADERDVNVIRSGLEGCVTLGLIHEALEIEEVEKTEGLMQDRILDATFIGSSVVVGNPFKITLHALICWAASSTAADFTSSLLIERA
jgi:hypothetical protein